MQLLCYIIDQDLAVPYRNVLACDRQDEIMKKYMEEIQSSQLCLVFFLLSVSVCVLRYSTHKNRRVSDVYPSINDDDDEEEEEGGGGTRNWSLFSVTR